MIQPPALRERPRILVVEDDAEVAGLLKNLLTKCDYRIAAVVGSGEEALSLLLDTSPDPTLPDLILMDIQLPEVSGLEVTKWLKEDDELHVIPVIAVTAFAMKGDEERIRQGGCEAYVSKPISVPKFIETIKTYLGDA